MAQSKKDKFSNILGSLPTKEAAVSGSNAALQSIVEGDRPEYRYLRLETIQLNPQNDYAEGDNEDEIRELAEDIRRNGLLHNIVVSLQEDGHYLLLSGERRLKACQLLYSEERDPKWEKIYSLVRKELRPIEEAIILDAANLQTRGSGAGGEARYRKATARFVDNLRAHFNISEAEATSLAKSYAGASESTISRNVTIEKHLIPELKTLLDKGLIKKLVANSYAALTPEEQQHIAQSYDELLKTGSDANLAAFGEQAVDAIRKNQPVTSVKPSTQRKPASARERQRDSLMKSCERIGKGINDLTSRAALIKRIDADTTDSKQRSIVQEVETLYQQLAALRRSLK